MEPSYSIKKFTDACKQGQNKVYVTRGARETARTDFRLNTEKDILNFIGYGGLENLKFDHTKLWENNPEPNEPVMVDSYGFYSGSLFGYIAFMFREKTKKWIIKSFKKNIQSGIRNQPLSGLKDMMH